MFGVRVCNHRTQDIYICSSGSRTITAFNIQYKQYVRLLYTSSDKPPSPSGLSGLDMATAIELTSYLYRIRIETLGDLNPLSSLS